MQQPIGFETPLDLARIPPTDGAVVGRSINPRLDIVEEDPVSAIVALGVVAGLVMCVVYGRWSVALVLGTTGYIYLALARRRWARRVAALRPQPLWRRYRSWGELVAALRQSPFAVRWQDGIIRERDHIYLGTFEGTDVPVLMHTQSLRTHAHILGSTASGKTFRFLVPASFQLLQRRDASLIVVDLKGSRSLFNAYRLEARRLGLPFKFFSTDTQKPSHLFNPMLMPGYRALTLNQKVMSMLNALSLIYTDAYGQGHFGSVNEETYRAVLRAHPDVRSLRAVRNLLRQPEAALRLGVPPRNFASASGLLAALDRLVDYDQIQATPGDGFPDAVFANAIDMEEVTRRPTVLYFDLATNLERTASRLVGRLALELLVAICRRNGPSRVPVYVIIDEAQHILSSSFSPVISQARDLRISVWLAHQTLGDLKTADGDFTSLVTGNTTTKVFFTASDLDDREFIGETGGIILRSYKSVTRERIPLKKRSGDIWIGRRLSTTESARPEQRMDSDAINALNAYEDVGLLTCAPGHGLLRLKYPAAVRFGFAHSREQFERLDSIPWPAPQPWTLPSSLPIRRPAPDEPVAPASVRSGGGRRVIRRPLPAAQHGVPDRQEQAERPGKRPGATEEAVSRAKPVKTPSPKELAAKAESERLAAELRALHSRMKSGRGG